MRFFEVTILSDHHKLKEYAPKFYRSNKFIFINSSNCQIPQRWCGVDCKSTKSNWIINSYRLEIVDETLYIRCKTKTLELGINPEDFAVRVMLPMESDFMSFELISVEYLKEDTITEPIEPVKDVLKDPECYDELEDLSVIIEPVLSDSDTEEIDEEIEQEDEFDLVSEESEDTIEPFVPKSLKKNKKK